MNDDTGTEKYISLDENAELVFEYENYQPNVPLLGTEKVRWSLDKFTGITSIELSEGFIFDEFIINGDTNVDKSDSFDIEAKDYAVYLYDAVELEYSEETAGNWFLRIEGEYDTEFDSYFVFESFMIPMYTYDVKQHVLDMETNKDSFTLYGINVLEITKAEILAELDD